MADANSNTKPKITPEQANKESDAAYALMQLGDLVRCSNEHGGYEGITEQHWTAIGIAIEQLADSLYTGSLTNPMDRAATEQEAAQ